MVCGGGEHRLCHFLYADSTGPGPDGISDFFSYTLSRNKGADKAVCAQAGLGICCSNVSKANFS